MRGTPALDTLNPMTLGHAPPTPQCHRCEDLAAADVDGSSDPFVVFKLGQESQQSSVVKSNLNPKWQGAFFDFYKVRGGPGTLPCLALPGLADADWPRPKWWGVTSDSSNAREASTNHD